MFSISLLNIVLFLFSLCTTVFSAAHAKEGFSSDITRLPPRLQIVWHGTFALRTSVGVGSAFLARINKTSTGAKLYFFTADHILSSLCAAGRACADMKLVEDSPYNKNSMLPHSQVFQGIKIVYRNPNMDISLLEVTTTIPIADRLEAIPISGTCEMTPDETYYGFGFPGLANRVDPRNLIDNRSVVKKRFSEGMWTSPVRPQGSSFTYDGYTVDAEPGSSGGPVVNSSGELVGFVHYVNAYVNSPKLYYLGGENPGAMQWQILAHKCKSLQSFYNSIDVFAAQAN